VISFTDGAARDEGIEPLAHFVDAAGPDALAATVEMDAAGEIYPVLYVRRGGEVDERILHPDPVNAFGNPAYIRALTQAVADLT